MKLGTLVAAILLAIACVARAARSMHQAMRIPPPGRIGILLNVFVALGMGIDEALLMALLPQLALWRYAIVYVGLVLGPLVFTAGYTAAMSRRYRDAPQGAALLWLGALCGILLFLVISRGRM